jgi:two-component system nitrogen regulation response regulator GlnG
MTVNGTDDGATRRPLAQLARVVAGAVPTMVDQLASAHPRRVYREAMAMMERPLLLHALNLTGGNQLRAARLLGVNRNTLRKRCRDLGLEPTRRPGRAAGLAP